MIPDTAFGTSFGTAFGTALGTAFGTALGTAFGTALGTAFTTAFTTAFNRSAVGMVIIGVTAVMMVFMESFASIGVTAVGQPKSLPIALVAPSP